MRQAERMAELMYGLIRLRRAEAGRYPKRADLFPEWMDLPSLSKSELALMFREMLGAMALDEEERPGGRG